MDGLGARGTGATVRLQAWDFNAGSNFIIEMQRAAADAQRTIAVLSPDYLASHFAAPEWAAAFAQDPEGLKRKLVPVRVRDCAPDGMLKAIVYIDLVGLNEADARNELLTPNGWNMADSFPMAFVKGSARA